MQIKFKNLDRSQMVIEIVKERFDVVIEKFPELTSSGLIITLEMENSPIQAGPDFFKVKVNIKNGRYSGIIISKSNSNLHHALADVVGHMLELLNRFGDKKRVVSINQKRKALNIL
jgi:hypothetical protein